ITFRLRNDIHFSDGTPVTTDDVVFTYETIVNPKVDAANVASRYTDVVKVTKIDNLVVKFSLKRPYFKALENLSFIRTGILPKHVYQFADPDRFNKRVSDPVGSGPYVFEKWDVGRGVVLRRNENYWGRKPKLKKVIYRFIANPVASVQALRSHQVDIVIPEPEQFAELANDEHFCKEFCCLSYWTPSTPFYYIGWNQDTPFFSDRLVRLAMTHIINREEIIAHLLQGHGRQVTGPFYPDRDRDDPNIEPLAYDPQMSGQLLDRAGWRDTNGDGLRDKDGVPLRFKFMYSNSYALFERLAKLLKDEAAKVGVEVIAEPCEWSILWDRLNRREFQAYIAGWAGDAVKDPYQLFHSSQIGNGGSNFVGFRNPEADVIIEQARRTTPHPVGGDDARSKLYQHLHAILHEEQPYTFLFTRPTFRLVDRRFKNVVIHKLGLDYLEWYVPNSEQRYE
ncbi:MAG: ABC transporter substrate-binding protein, partial [Sedimentisphaerales bacterium]|nr:ABC transporter substrate-binding protein [Sedimentisphaerales bacterium]